MYTIDTRLRSMPLRHRVEYVPGSVAVSVSLFEVSLPDMVRNNPLFLVTLWPNLAKELLGIKTQ